MPVGRVAAATAGLLKSTCGTVKFHGFLFYKRDKVKIKFL